MMSEIMGIMLALVTGVLLGAIYFGGLWWTVQKGISSKKAAFWFSGSMLLRTGIALTGFYFIGHDYWERLLMCLFGFFVARLIVERLTKVAEKPAFLEQEGGHAPQP
jgi:F1F0 ATPase subunit 2